MALLGSLLRGTDWSQVTEYLSPVFFQIVPPLAMAGQVKNLTSDYLNKSRFAEVCHGLEAGLTKAELPPPSSDDRAAEPELAGLTTADRQARGQMLLKLYFWQLLKAETVLLDLRFASFDQTAAGAKQYYRWAPKPLYITYDAAFGSAVRDLYQGFYQDDQARFDRALAALQLSAAKPLFLKHFGTNQSSQQFLLSDFRQTFHGIFVACKEARSRLHPNFLGFGAGLYCLYEHLEQLGGSFDVRAAFFAAAGEAL